MGRPPANGAPSFRFNHSEVSQMEAILQEHKGRVPEKDFLVALAEKFSKAPDRAGRMTVHMKQVWNWFQNRRYALRSKMVKSPGMLNVPPMNRDEAAHMRSMPPGSQQLNVASGHNVVRSTSETLPMEFEAKSSRDGAWYDVQAFISHRYHETGNPEVVVRFAGFGPEEDEWVNVRKHVRQRSLPCEASECIAVLPGDLILCFQEGKEQALYFDAHVLDAQRRRHDIRGCRCRFLVRYDHDQSEEIVPLRKVCRRPETDYRFQQLHAANEAASASASSITQKPLVASVSSSSLMVTGSPVSNMIARPAASILSPVPAPCQPPGPAVISVPINSQAPASLPSLFTPAPASVHTPVPVPAPSPDVVSVTVPVHMPARVPVSVPAPTASIPASAPFSAAVLQPKVESHESSNPRAFSEANSITSAEGTSVTPASKTSEKNNEEASRATGNTSSLENMSTNIATAVPGLGNVEGSGRGQHRLPEVAETGSADNMSTAAAGDSSVSVKTEKE